MTITESQALSLADYLRTPDAAKLAYRDIAADFGVSPSTVAYIARGLELPKRKRGRRPSPPHAKEVTPKKERPNPLRSFVRENALSMMDIEIARATGVTSERVRQVRKSLGFPPSRPLRCARGHVYAEVGKRLRSGKSVCAACYPIPIHKTLTDTCENCGESFTLTGRDRSTYLRNRRTFPNLRRLCPACGKAARRDGHGLRQWHAQHRALGMSYKREARTHCRQGHEQTDANIYTSPSGYQLCRPCKQYREKQWYLRTKDQRRKRRQAGG